MIEPYIDTVKTELSAFEIYSLFKDEINSVFLDSGLGQEQGCYSIIGIHPFQIYKHESNGDDPFETLKEILEKYTVINNTNLPFVGGGIGYFSYDLMREIEPIDELCEELVSIPTCYFNFYDQVIIYDHIYDKVYISVLGIQEDKYKAMGKIKSAIYNGEKVEDFKYKKNNICFKSPFTKDEYMKNIERVRKYISNGDIYITNLTHTFTAKVKKDPYATYKILRKINPAPFGAFMQLDGFSILSSSPERFLQIIDKKVTTRPIKGTKPRGKTSTEDEINKEILLNSEKDKAELLMIVDLERNDLSKVCKPHSVKVKGIFELEVYPTVYHLVATVEGELDNNKTSIDCIKACFPGGSITGAPKIRSMEIIEELEQTKRNIYTGCIGYLGFDGNIDLNIVIRTILMKDDKVYIGAGGGITWESDCEEEYMETLHKAKALFKSLRYEEVSC